jgi:hypothetical protein
MQYAFGTETKAIFANRCMTRIAASEIFGGGLFDPVSDFSL